MCRAITAVFVLSLVAQTALAASPSFNCRTQRSLIERLICSDTELSRLDVEMDKAYRAAMHRAGSNAAAIRNDQRDYNSGSATGVEYRLNGASPDARRKPPKDFAENGNYGRAAAISDLKDRTEKRIEMLNAIVPDRVGFEGRWLSQSGFVEVAKIGTGFQVSAKTGTFGWTRYWCEAEGPAHIEGNQMIVDAQSTRNEPLTLRLTRDGVGLRSEALLEDGKSFCARGGELEKIVYFLPVPAGVGEP